jgi:uncharacterized protein (UPF0261 family)
MRTKSRTKDEWKKLIEDFRSSKQKMGDFCKAIEMNAKTFKKRYYELRGDEGGVIGKKGFVGFKILQPVTSGMKVHLPNGIVVDIAGQDALRLIKALKDVA